MKGLGVMIRELGGNESSVEAYSSAIGKRIKALVMTENELRIELEDGTAIGLSDEGQSCCEHRWMHTDDDLSKFVGATLGGMEVRDGGDAPEDANGEYRDSQFLIIETSAGQFTVVNYNEHNGYYGGFDIYARRIG